MSDKKILTISLIAAVAAVVLINLYVFGIRQSYAADPVIVLQAVRDVAAGKVLAPADYKELQLPRKLFESVTSYAVTKQDLPVLASTPLRRSLKPGDIVSYSHLSRSVQEGLRDTIPMGKRAISIQVSEESSVSNFVQPGDLVDIIATIITQDRAVTKPLLTGIRILAVGGELGERDQGAAQRGRYNTVTLEVSLEQAETVIWARDQGRAAMTLALRNPKDAAEAPPTRVISGADVMGAPPPK
jgi:pilus assembly protein CpaB